MNTVPPLIALAKVVQEMRIPHTDYAEGRKILNEIWDNTHWGLNLNAAIITGESGSGKTTLQKSLVIDYPPKRTEAGLLVPVAYVILPVKPTISKTLTAILTSLGDPLPNKGKEDDRKERVKVLLKQCETKIIIFDEYQRLIEGTQKKIYDVFETLKDYISEDLGVVIAGLPSCADVIKDNSQIKRRLLAAIVLKRFVIGKKSDFANFGGILKSFHHIISQHLDIPQLWSQRMVESFYCASGGLIAYVSKILSYAITQAHKNKRTYIKLEDLAYARKKTVFEHAVWDPYGEPFSDNFDMRSIPNYDHISSQICWDEKSYTRKNLHESLNEVLRK